ncbi:hypothetical protein [Candidatus Poriferisodalis sp.]|uniref:hypothetical protein n=1 Tax=Candidatus Poriferisodalis sp. TaxID=3101277 RepID=UPI003B5B6647
MTTPANEPPGFVPRLRWQTLLKLLRTNGLECTVHGFRSSFKTWVIETTSTPWAVGEAALAHVVATPPRPPTSASTCSSIAESSWPPGPTSLHRDADELVRRNNTRALAGVSMETPSE